MTIFLILWVVNVLFLVCLDFTLFGNKIFLKFIGLVVVVVILLNSSDRRVLLLVYHRF